MEESSRKLRSKNEFEFASSSILSQVARGILVGLIVGIIVGSFRFLIEESFHFVQHLYKDQSNWVINLFIILIM